MMNTVFLAFGIGMPEAILAIVVVMFLFGATKLPEMFKGFGQGIKEFKKATREEPEQIDSDSPKDDNDTKKDS